MKIEFGDIVTVGEKCFVISSVQSDDGFFYIKSLDGTMGYEQIPGNILKLVCKSKDRLDRLDNKISKTVIEGTLAYNEYGINDKYWVIKSGDTTLSLEDYLIKYDEIDVKITLEAN